jgi:hypothetical protein
MAKLNTVLSRVSANCLRGQPVPDDLRSLWQAQLDGDEFLADHEFLLVDDLNEEFFEGYDENSGAPEHSVRAYKRMFEHIAFVATTMDGGRLGYWLGATLRVPGQPVAESPVVELDSEGQFELKGANLAEYFLIQFGDSPEEFSEIRDWLVGLNIPVGVSGQEEIWAHLEGFDDPNELSRRYQSEESAGE